MSDGSNSYVGGGARATEFVDPEWRGSKFDRGSVQERKVSGGTGGV
jgi:hypothetical protein